MLVRFLKKGCSQVLQLIIILTITSKVHSQDATTQAKSMLATVQQAYKQAAYLGFNVKYIYANADKPQDHLDSLGGLVQINKNHCRFAIDSTETIVTDSLTIQVMEADKAIYLSRSIPSSLVDPVNLLDSMFAHMDGVQSGIIQHASTEELTFSFPPGKMYSKIRMVIDRRTGYFLMIHYSLQTAGLVADELIDGPGHPGPYHLKGQVEIVFSHYEQGHFGDAIFAVSNYVTKTAGKYIPARQYSGYQVFLTSSNL